MAAGPNLTIDEVRVLGDFLQMMSAASDSGRDSEYTMPGQRWANYRPASFARHFTPAVVQLLAPYGWQHQNVEQSAIDSLTDYVDDTLHEAGINVEPERLHGSLVAAAYWATSSSMSAFKNDQSLMALEKFSAFVNGFAQSLPLRYLPGEPADAHARRFAKYQRRCFGYETPIRSPQELIRQLPRPALELIATYEHRLMSETPISAHALAEALAIAVGRPVDETIAFQFDLAMATACVWRELTTFGMTPGGNPLTEQRPPEATEKWDAATGVITHALDCLSAPSPGASNPWHVQPPALAPVAGVILDAASIRAFARLHEYVNAFAAYLQVVPASARVEGQDLANFDRFFRGGGRSATSGSELVATLPALASSIVTALVTPRGRTGSPTEIATELATVMGDAEESNSYLHTLQTAAFWASGRLSPLETTASGTSVTQEVSERSIDAAPQTQAETPVPGVSAPTTSGPAPKRRETDGPAYAVEIEPFLLANAREAEALLDFGAAVAELVRFSRMLEGNEGTPEGWWSKFHRQALSPLPSPPVLMERLPDGSRRILRQFAQVLSNPAVPDATEVARAIAPKLDRWSENLSVATLAIGLATGAVWGELDRMHDGRRADTLLGAQPSSPGSRFFCERAQAQIDWGLQHLETPKTVPTSQ